MSTQKHTVLIAEDEPILQMGIASYLTTNNDSLEIIGMVNNGEKAIIETRKQQPDIVIMDLEMPILDGIQATRTIKQELPETRIVMLTVFTNQKQVHKALDAGADAYCIKNIEMEQLQLAIAAASKGSMYLDAQIARCAVNPHSSSLTATELGLDDKEVTILQMIAESKSNTEIGKALHTSPNTIKWIIHRIFDKLGVRSRVQAALKAWQLGLIQMEL